MSDVPTLEELILQISSMGDNGREVVRRYFGLVASGQMQSLIKGNNAIFAAQIACIIIDHVKEYQSKPPFDVPGRRTTRADDCLRVRIIKDIKIPDKATHYSMCEMGEITFYSTENDAMTYFSGVWVNIGELPKDCKPISELEDD